MPREVSNLAVTAIGTAVLLALGGVAWFGLGANTSGPNSVNVQGPTAPGVLPVHVHVSGAVAHPGVVEVSAGAMVADAIAAAGGASRSADLAAINLASPVRDGEHVVIPHFPEGGTHSARSSDGVNLNTATASEFESLPGVGPVLAQRIVEFRDVRGPFETIEDLLDVPGIGESKLATMRSAIAGP